jgi:hypothetical protein
LGQSADDGRFDPEDARGREARARLLVPSIIFRRPLIGIALAVALLLGVGVGWFYYALSNGPITFRWLAPEIVASLEELSGKRFSFELAGASITNSDHGPALSVDGLVVRSGGRAIIAAPRAQLALDLPSLLIGRVRLRRLEIMDLDLRLSVMPDGQVALSAGAEPLQADVSASAPAESVGAPAARVALLRIMGTALRGLMDLATNPDSAIGSFDRLGVTHGQLRIDDRTTDRALHYEDVALSLDKGDGGMSFSLAASGPSGRWTADALASGAPGGKRDFRAAVRDLSIDEISLFGGFRTTRFDTDAPLAMDLDFTLAPNDEILRAAGRLDVGKGFFRLEERDHEPVMIEHFAVAADWSPQTGRLAMTPIEVKAGGFDFVFTGEATPIVAVTPADGKPTSGAEAWKDAWKISLRLAQPTVVQPERAGEKPVQISGASFNARLLNGDGKFVIDDFSLSGPEIRAALKADIAIKGDSHIRYELDVPEAKISALARLWPSHVTPGVRVWFVDHALAGKLKNGRAVGDFDEAALMAMHYERPPPDESLLVEGEIVDGAVEEVVEGLAPITGIMGRVRVTGRTATFKATAAALETGPGRRIALSEGSFSITDNALQPAPATLDVRVGGAVETIADVLALPEIRKYASIPVEPGSLKGRLDGRLRLDFEIGDDARDDHVKFWVDATTNNLSVERLIGKERLEAGVLRIVANPDGLLVTGSGKIMGNPATLELHRGFGETGPAQAQLTFTFDETARQRAGYALPGITGPVSAIIRTPLPLEELKTTVELDFSRTAFDNPIPGLIKPAGRPAKAAFLLARKPESISLEQIALDAGPVQIRGEVELSSEGAFRGARFSSVKLSPGDDLRVDVQRVGELIRLTMRGANVDARPMMQSFLRTGGASANATGGRNNGGGPAVDYAVDFKSAIVTGHGKQILSNVDLKLESRGGRPKTLAMSGNFGRERITASIERNQNDAPQLAIATNDAGSLLSFLDLYRKMESGVLSANIQLAQGRADGEARIRDFYVKGEPTMRQLMAQGGNVRADERGVMRFDPDSVQVGQLLADFGWGAGRLTVRSGVMSGPAIGMTFDGFIDFPRDSIDLAGSYVPAYALNSLLSHIPVVGVLVAGGQNEGVFALNYRLSGALSSPVVTVNPLSAIAPGLMRKIMGVIDGTAHVPGLR